MITKMKQYYLFIFAFLFLAGVTITDPADALSKNFFINEDFMTLTNWRTLKFDKVKRQSNYSVVKDDYNTILKIESNNSASGLILKRTFDVYTYSDIEWRWKITNVLKRGDASQKSGDDYPVRVYVLFKFDPENATLWEKTKFGAIKLIYGEYPPHSSINYIWANRRHNKKVLANPYTDRVQMFIMQAGDSKKGEWIIEKRNIVKDYKKAFGKEPPKTGSIAIMGDSDNTGGKSTAFIDYLHIF